MDRLASAPISWGVCEVPGWGLELPFERVLSEMASLGLAATELGPDGYLTTDPAELRRLVGGHGLQMIGGFVPVVVHDPSQESATIDAVRRIVSLMSGAGATVFVSAALTSWDWAPREKIDAAGWRFAARMLARLDEIAGEFGMVQALHAHFGTIIETRADIERVLDTSEVGFTLDTGHLLIGGWDPLGFVEDHFDRIRHVHLKDVEMATADLVVAGELSLMEGVQSGMFCRLGDGDVGIGPVVKALDRRGYDGWYVIEQDTAITDGPPPDGTGPVSDVAASIEHLRGVFHDSFSQSAET